MVTLRSGTGKPRPCLPENPKKTRDKTNEKAIEELYRQERIEKRRLEPPLPPANFYVEGRQIKNRQSDKPDFVKKRFKPSRRKRKSNQVNRELRPPEYYGYINGKAWKRRRRKKIESVGGKCERCKSDRFLHVHHLTYARLGREKDRDLEVLCKDCHALEHEDKGAMDSMTEQFCKMVRSF